MKNGENSNIKNELFHIVNKSNVVSVFAFFISCYMLLSPFFGNINKSQQINLNSKMEIIAYQAVEMEKKKNSVNLDALNNLRGPASVSGFEASVIRGSLGQDEMGNPYQYEIHIQSPGTKVIVWSDANKESRTEVLIPSEKQ